MKRSCPDFSNSFINDPTTESKGTAHESRNGALDDFDSLNTIGIETVSANSIESQVQKEIEAKIDEKSKKRNEKMRIPKKKNIHQRIPESLTDQQEDSERDKLIKHGYITPFAYIEGLEKLPQRTTIHQTSSLDISRENSSEDESDSDKEENHFSITESQSSSDVLFDGGLVIPGSLYDGLFPYQQIGVQWLWELHCQKIGGIISDEMGLGKTRQVIALLASLYYSKLHVHPTLIITPASVMNHWKKEFRSCSSVPVTVLHDLMRRHQTFEEAVNSLFSETIEEGKRRFAITSYDTVRLYHTSLLSHQWSYVILDEGHRIRNPDAEITIICKQFLTVHRLIISGVPIQNNLRELWSLVDFVFPGKLGTLPIFEEEFVKPITRGGYLNASHGDVQLSYNYSTQLRSLIQPITLRRVKEDVQDRLKLPEKSERILFCTLSESQRSSYIKFLQSNEVSDVLRKKATAFRVISTLRKICNHVDLLNRTTPNRPDDYGNKNRSGKLLVLEEILNLWKKEGHRLLLFCQTRQMLDIVDLFLSEHNYVYYRLDGSTPVHQRNQLIDSFNRDKNIDIFLLTSRAGGAGISLIGADRVILFDPDWNPSIDAQARERIYRIGQKRDVAVYRFVTKGTIEGSVYNLFMTPFQILKDSRSKRFFHTSDLYDLFTLDGKRINRTSFHFSSSKEEDTATERIFGLNSIENSIVEQPLLSNENYNNSKDDKNILNLLLSHNPYLTSALSHDKIIASSTIENIDIPSQNQLKHHIDRSLQNLQESRNMMKNHSRAMPTWTGKSGFVGALSNPFSHSNNYNSPVLVSLRIIPKRLFSNASQSSTVELKSPAIEQKNKIFNPSANFSDTVPASSAILNAIQRTKKNFSTISYEDEKYYRFMDALYRILSSGGPFTSDQIIASMEGKITTNYDKLVFREMLHQLANFEKESRTWSLKQDFK